MRKLKKMKKLNSKILIVAAVMLLVAGCGKDEKVEEVIRPVKVVVAGGDQATENIVFSGITVPSKETILSFKIAGPVANINLTQGQKVKKGEIVAEMDTRDYKVNLEVYKKKYDAAKAASDNATFQYNRAEKMYKGGAMSKKNFDMVTAQKKAAISMLKEAEQGVANATNKLKDTQLKAPYDGYISKKFVDSGSVVNAGTPIAVITAEKAPEINISVAISKKFVDSGSVVNAGTPIAVITAEKAPEINISVAGKDIKLLENISEAVFIPNDTPDKTYSLTLKEIGKNPEFAKITYPVVFEIKGGDDIRVGSSGKVIVKSNIDARKEIFIPVTALFEDNGSKVYIFENGTAVAKDVKIGNLKNDGTIEILEGLKKDDKVISAGVNNIVDGEKVKLLPEVAKDVKIGNLKNDGTIEILEGLKKDDKVISAGVNNIVDGEKVKLLPEPSKTNVGNIM